MARYELGAIYKIDGKNKGTYYARLLTKDCYGVFAPLKGELNEETFSQTPYHLYLICNSFPEGNIISAWTKAIGIAGLSSR